MPSFNPAIEIISDYEYVSYQRDFHVRNDRELLESVNLSYLQPDTSIVLNGILEKSAEIPFCSNISEVTRIFRDGTMTYEKNISLDPANNPLLFLHESPVDLSALVSRITISSGVLTTYNSEGDVLYQQSVEIPDYSDVVQELSREVANYNNPSNFHDPANTVRDINWLRSKIATSSVESLDFAPDSTFVFEVDDKIVLEQILDSPSEQHTIKYRTIYSSDVTEILGQYKLVDNEVQFSTQNFYDESSSNQATIINILGKRPIRTFTKEKVTHQDGSSSVRIEERNYSINTIHLNL